MLGITFIYIFLPITLFIHQQAPMKRKNAVLFMSSLLLYGWCDPTLLLALIFSLPFVGTAGTPAAPEIAVGCRHFRQPAALGIL